MDRRAEADGEPAGPQPIPQALPLPGLPRPAGRRRAAPGPARRERPRLALDRDAARRGPRARCATGSRPSRAASRSPTSCSTSTRPASSSALAAILERIEGDLRAAPIAAALRLALLHAPAGEPARDLARAASRRCGSPAATSSLPAAAQWRERNPWLAFEDGVRLVRGFVQRLESGAWGPVPARLGDDLRSLAEGSATAVVKQASPSGARRARSETADAGRRGLPGPRIRLVLGPAARSARAGAARVGLPRDGVGAGPRGRRRAPARAAVRARRPPVVGLAGRRHHPRAARRSSRSWPATRGSVLLEGDGPESLVAGVLGGVGAGYPPRRRAPPRGGATRAASWSSCRPARAAARRRGRARTSPCRPSRAGRATRTSSPARACSRRRSGDPRAVLAPRTPRGRWSRPRSSVLSPRRAGQLRGAAGRDPRRPRPRRPPPPPRLGPPSAARRRARRRRRPTRRPRPDGDRGRRRRSGRRPSGQAPRPGRRGDRAAPRRRPAARRGRRRRQPAPDHVERLLALVRDALSRPRARRLVEIEPDRWWLGDRADREAAAAPLADRVEWAVFSLLSTAGPLSEAAFLDRVAGLFTGPDLPDEALVRACLDSYRSMASTPDRLVTDRRPRAAQPGARRADRDARRPRPPARVLVWIGARQQPRRVGGDSLADRLDERELRRLPRPDRRGPRTSRTSTSSGTSAARSPSCGRSSGRRCWATRPAAPRPDPPRRAPRPLPRRRSRSGRSSCATSSSARRCCATELETGDWHLLKANHLRAGWRRGGPTWPTWSRILGLDPASSAGRPALAVRRLTRRGVCSATRRVAPSGTLRPAAGAAPTRAAPGGPSRP